MLLPGLGINTDLTSLFSSRYLNTLTFPSEINSSSVIPVRSIPKRRASGRSTSTEFSYISSARASNSANSLRYASLSCWDWFGKSSGLTKSENLAPIRVRKLNSGRSPYIKSWFLTGLRAAVTCSVTSMLPSGVVLGTKPSGADTSIPCSIILWRVSSVRFKKLSRSACSCAIRSSTESPSSSKMGSCCDVSSSGTALSAPRRVFTKSSNIPMS